MKQGASLDHETKDSYTGQVPTGRCRGKQPSPTSPINVTDVEGVIASAPTG